MPPLASGRAGVSRQRAVGKRAGSRAGDGAHGGIGATEHLEKWVREFVAALLHTRARGGRDGVGRFSEVSRTSSRR